MKISDEKIRLNFCLNFADWVNSSWHGTRKELAGRLGITVGQLSNIMAGLRCPNEAMRRKIAENYMGIPYEEAIGVDKKHPERLTRDQAVRMIERTTYPQLEKPLTKEERIVMKHKAIILQFVDKQLAADINEKLIMLERIDPSFLGRVYDLVDSLLKAVSAQEGKSVPSTSDRRQHHDRRQTDDPHIVTEDGNRRSGNDRRHAS